MLESLQQFHFLRPWWFLTLLPAGWLVWQLTRAQAHGDHWTRLIAPHLLPFLLDGKGAEEKSRVGWLLLPLTVAVLALAGPTWQKLPNPVEKNTSALVVLWDMSPSMLAQDVRPSRLERSRLKLIDLLKTRKDGLTALIAYSGEAYVVTPLTEDVQTIINLLPSLGPTTLPSVGSNPEMAMSEAKKLLKAGNLDHGDILYLTDGIDNRAFANLDDQLSKGKDRITIWGVGTEDGAPIPLPRGGFLQTGKDLVVAKLNSAELKHFAEEHKGYYVPAQADDGDIKFLSQLLVRTDQTQVQSDKTFDQWSESGQYLSLALLPLCLWLFRRGSLLLLLMAISLGNPQPASAAPTTGAEEESKPAVAEPAWQKDLRNTWNGFWFTPDQQGARLLKQGDAPAAAEHFANPAWQATAQYQAGNFAAAAKTFSQDTSATGLYNQATALLKKGDYDGAIKAFDEALKLQPNYSAAQHNKDIAIKLKALKAKQPKQNNGQKDPNQKQKGDNKDQQEGGEQNQDGEKSEDNNSSGEQNKSDASDKQGDDNKDKEQNQEKQDQEQKDPAQDENKQAGDDRKPGDENKPEEDKKPGADKQSDEAKQSAEEKAAAQEKAQQEYAKQLAEAAKEQKDDTKAAEMGAASEASKEDQENQQKIDQALRRVPDDPGGLLRNKFQYQYKERRMNPQAPKDANNNPESRW